MRARFLVAPGVGILVLLHLLTRPGGSRPERTFDRESLTESRGDWVEPYTPPRWGNLPAEQAQSAQTREQPPRQGSGHDGLDDFLVFASEHLGRNRSPANRVVLAQGEELFRRLDLNGDGVLDEVEMPTALRLELGKWDANNDGVIDQDEFLVYFSDRVERVRTRNTNGETARRGPQQSERFRAMDTENDAQIALYEWKDAGGSVEEFRKLDRNGDGFLTPDELTHSSIVQEVKSPGQPAFSQVSGSAIMQSGIASGSAVVAVSDFAGGFIFQPGSAKTMALASVPDQIEARHVAAAAKVSPSPAPTRSVAASKPAFVQTFARSSVRTSAPAAAPAPAPPPAVPLYPDATEASPLNTGAVPYWTARNNQNDAQLLLDGHTNVLFLGDSITDWLMSGRGTPVWDKFFAPLGSDDFAIAGLTTSQVLWQVETGRVELASPDVVVLMIGTNNLALGQSPPEVAAGITKIVNEIRGQLPRTQILLLGILPRGESPFDPLRTLVAEVNDLISTLGTEDRVTYLDIGGYFLQPDGTISADVMPDYLHPSLWGYDIYTAAIWGTLLELLARG